MTARTLIYVPEFSLDAFRNNCKAHGVKTTLFQTNYFDIYVFNAVGEELKNKDWVNELAENCIEVSIYLSINS